MLEVTTLFLLLVLAYCIMTIHKQTRIIEDLKDIIKRQTNLKEYEHRGPKNQDPAY